MTEAVVFYAQKPHTGARCKLKHIIHFRVNSVSSEIWLSLWVEYTANSHHLLYYPLNLSSQLS